MARTHGPTRISVSLSGELDVTGGRRFPLDRRPRRSGCTFTHRPARAALRGPDDRTIPAITYADWGEFVLEPGGGVQQLLEQTVRRCSTS